MNLKRFSIVLVLVLFGLLIVGCGPKNDQTAAEVTTEETAEVDTIQETSEPDEPEPFEEEPAAHEIISARDAVLNFIQDQSDISFLDLDWEEIQLAKDDYSFSAENWEVVINTGINLYQERVYWVTIVNEEIEIKWVGRVYPGGDVEEGPHGILAALDSVIIEVNIYFPDDAPSKLLVWVGEDIALEEYEFTQNWLYSSDMWKMNISYVFVGDGTPIYAVSLINNQTGFLWFSEHDADWNLLVYQATQ